MEKWPWVCRVLLIGLISMIGGIYLNDIITATLSYCNVSLNSKGIGASVVIALFMYEKKIIKSH